MAPKESREPGEMTVSYLSDEQLGLGVEFKDLRFIVLEMGYRLSTSEFIPLSLYISEQEGILLGAKPKRGQPQLLADTTTLRTAINEYLFNCHTRNPCANMPVALKNPTEGRG